MDYGTQVCDNTQVGFTQSRPLFSLVFYIFYLTECLEHIRKTNSLCINRIDKTHWKNHIFNVTTATTTAEITVNETIEDNEHEADKMKHIQNSCLCSTIECSAWPLNWTNSNKVSQFCVNVFFSASIYTSFAAVVVVARIHLQNDNKSRTLRVQAWIGTGKNDYAKSNRSRFNMMKNAIFSEFLVRWNFCMYLCVYNV